MFCVRTSDSVGLVGGLLQDVQRDYGQESFWTVEAALQHLAQASLEL